MGREDIGAAGALLLALLAACAVEPAREAPPQDEELAQLAQWMTGGFEQATRGSGRSQAGPRRLSVFPFRTDRPNERWLYAAQWAPGDEQQTRRFVFRLKRADREVIVADLFELDDPSSMPAVPGPDSLNALSDSDLTRRRGCRIWLSRDGLSFSGGTRGSDCTSEFRGAARVRIELVIREDEIVEWIQGFDASGERLWGGDAGARTYRRVSG